MMVYFFYIIHHLVKTNNENLELYIYFYLKLRGKAMHLPTSFTLMQCLIFWYKQYYILSILYMGKR